MRREIKAILEEADKGLTRSQIFVRMSERGYTVRETDIVLDRMIVADEIDYAIIGGKAYYFKDGAIRWETHVSGVMENSAGTKISMQRMSTEKASKAW